jgi:ketosteroid isomerase-like protein
MRPVTSIAAALLLASACAPVFAEEMAEVSAADCFLAGIRANDAAAVTSCYAPDAVLWIPNAPMAKGSQAIHDLFAGWFSGATVKSMDIAPMGSTRAGDEVTTWGTWTMVTIDKATGKETTQAGRFVDVSRKVDGKWVYVVDHASDDPQPPPPPPAG